MLMTQAKMTSADVARRLDVTPAAVRHWARTGRLIPAETTVSGIRLFDADDIERLAAERKKAERKKRGAGRRR
jgi:DNA-binding transcriptional MerR regulator